MADIMALIRKNKNDIIMPVVVLLAICIIIPLALAVTNKVTVNRIAELEKQKAQDAMSGLIAADSFESSALTTAGGEKIEYYAAVKDGEEIGYIFETADKGYGGAVSVMTAVNPDGTVKSVAILDVSGETPGLGQNAAKESFYSQYSGKKGGISVHKNGADSDKNEINAVTGATITSSAVTRAVNKALDNYSALEASKKEAADLEG